MAHARLNRGFQISTPLASIRALFVLMALLITNTATVAASQEEVSMTDYPSIVYVANPYTICLGALIREQTVLTDARCLYPFSNTSSVPSEVGGLLKPGYLMVGLPTVNTSATMHGILLSTQVFTKPEQAASRASTFLGLVETYVDNSTFYAVDTSKVHAYYPQSQYIEDSEQNFDVGVVTLKVPLKGRPLAKLFLDDLQADYADLSALSFSTPNPSSDPATQQVLYKGVDLTKLSKTDVNSISRSQCDSNYKAAYGLSDMKSFNGHSLPGNNSPVFCSSIYDNTTHCDLDTGISITQKTSDDINSANLNSTIFFVPDGSSIRVISIGQPHLFEVRTDSMEPCSSNGFIHFPRSGLYTDWIGWATGGSIASNGTWINKALTGDIIADFVDNRDGGDDSSDDSDKKSGTMSRISGMGYVAVIASIFTSLLFISF